MVERLDAVLGVEGVLADQLPGDEDVTGGAGDDDGGGLAVVFGTDGDLVALPDADGAAKDSNPVGGGGLTEGRFLGPALGVWAKTWMGRRRSKLRWGRWWL